jgi:tRNA (guanosine-2'-O-)-methyltransferase
VDSADAVIAKLEPLLLPRRIARMRAVLAARSDHATFVFERMTDPHNLSAALRSLDAFGWQDAHWVAPDPGLGLSHLITRGTDRWLTMTQHPDTEACFAALRARGYRILASEVSPGSPRLDTLPLEERTAFVFGNEHAGVSAETLALSDGRFHIGMHGFTESLNLSVACAITAFHARQQIRHLAASPGNGRTYLLPEDQAKGLYADWLRQSVRSAAKVLGE